MRSTRTCAIKSALGGLALRLLVITLHIWDARWDTSGLIRSERSLVH